MATSDASEVELRTPLLLSNNGSSASSTQSSQKLNSVDAMVSVPSSTAGGINGDLPGDVPDEEDEDLTKDASCGQRWLRRARTYLKFIGPGSLVAVGYMDPGNWATDIAAGSQFGYALLMVVLLSSVAAMFVQVQALRLGIATGKDLAEHCALRFSKPAVWALWVLAQIAIIATDMAEVIGSAIALQLLFGLDLVWGVVATFASVLVLLFGTSKHFNWLEYGILVLVMTMFGCFIYLMAASHVDFADMLFGYLPKGTLATNLEALYLAIGIIGATVMPHNLYLHSGVARDHAVGKNKKQSINYSTFDVVISLSFAFIVNSAILAVAAANFFENDRKDVATIQDAYYLLLELLGYGVATVFAVSLLISGQSSTITGTIAGQIVAEGFLNWRMRPWLRQLITRLFAVVPALVVVLIVGDAGIDQLLILSQVILSFQLPFAVFPLVYFTSDRNLMGDFVNGRVSKTIGYSISTILALLNAYLLIQVFIDIAS